jgi:type I restriction enzyme S subunit
MKAWQGSVAISELEGIVSPAYFIFEADHTENSRFLHYLFRSAEYIAAYFSISKGIRPNQWDLEPQQHSRLPVILPPPDEQTAIATFLDRETAKIDALVSEQERLIELLKEKRQAVISHAVTKGLDPNVKMKPSGVEWLGDVPEHWEVLPLKQIGTALIGLTYSPEDITEKNDGTLILRSSNVQNGEISFEDCVYVNKIIPEKLITKHGDILICSRNGSRSLIGKNAYITEISSGVSFGAFMTIFRCNYNEYMKHFFNSYIFEAQSGSFMSSTINQLTISTLNNMQVSLPPAEERRKIVEYLDGYIKAFGALDAEARSAIELLKERRSALISAAVTGKIDVRGLISDQQTVAE